MKAPKQRSFIFVLFGATGDLALKKIFPALEALWREGALGPDPRIIAVSRRDWRDGDLFSFLKENSSVTAPDFLKLVSYIKVDVEAGTGYDTLAKTVKNLQKGPTKREAVFYTSLAPMHHGEAIKGLREAGLLDHGKGRLMIEKPFGTDTKTACALDRLVASFLDADQVYRVDHYLGKDSVRAIMDLHESTPDFSNLLSAKSVASIRIRLFEEKGIADRGASYDHVGAFRDVGQNHMLEMLATVAAELPRAGDRGAAWQSARAKALKRLAPPAKTCDLSRRGQYEGYEKEKGVRPGSETETAFEVITNFSSGKLKSVPLILESGKKMPTSEVAIEILFKDISGLPRRITFKVQPDQEISIENRDGSVDAFDVPKIRDAYGNVIFAALRGEEKSFAGRAEIEALWSYTDHVVACWGKVPLERYSPNKPFLIK